MGLRPTPCPPVSMEGGGFELKIQALWLKQKGKITFCDQLALPSSSGNATLGSPWGGCCGAGRGSGQTQGAGRGGDDHWKPPCLEIKNLLVCPWGKQNHLTFLSLKFITSSVPFGEGNGTPLQYSCLENPMDGGAW